MMEETKKCDEEGCNRQATKCWYHAKTYDGLKATAALIVAFALLMIVVSVIITGFVSLLNDPNIDIKALDNVCSELYGEGHYYIPSKNNDITCAIRVDGDKGDVSLLNEGD